MKNKTRSCSDCIYLKSVVDEEKTEVTSDKEKYALLQWKHECRNVFMPNDVVSSDTAQTCPHYEEDI